MKRFPSRTTLAFAFSISIILLSSFIRSLFSKTAWQYAGGVSLMSTGGSIFNKSSAECMCVTDPMAVRSLSSLHNEAIHTSRCGCFIMPIIPLGAGMIPSWASFALTLALHARMMVPFAFSFSITAVYPLMNASASLELHSS